MRFELIQCVIVILVSLPYLDSKKNTFIPQVLDSNEDGSRYVILIEIENKKEKIELSRTIPPISHTKVVIGESEVQYIPIPKHFYDGVVVGQPGSKVYVQYNKTMEGHIYYNDDTYYIKPKTNENDEPSHVHSIVFANETEEYHFKCGNDHSDYENFDSNLLFPKEIINSKRNIRSPTYPTATGKFYLKVSVIIPYSLFGNRHYAKKDPKVISDNVFKIFHQAIFHFSFVDISPVCMVIDIWNDARKYVSVNTRLGKTALLREIKSYRNKTLYPRGDAYDLTTMFTDFHMGGSAGRATVGSLCDRSAAATFAFIGNHNDVYTAIFSHEAAHTIGAMHDGPNCVCQGNKKCIMADTNIQSPDYQTYFFSNCTKAYMEIEKEKPTSCLRIAPARELWHAYCGDGILSSGEECDCGDERKCKEEGRDRFCDAKTCKLKPGYDCDKGACCDSNGKFTNGSVCRHGDGNCILDVKCMGKSADCPAGVVYESLGVACDNNKGFCVQGECRSRDIECKKLWGASGKKASDFCDYFNIGGSYLGNCGIKNVKNEDTYSACLEKDKECGKLFCELSSPPENTPYHSIVINHMCGFADSRDGSFNEWGITRDFTPCDNTGKKVCYKHVCIDVNDAIRVETSGAVQDSSIRNKTNYYVGSNGIEEGNIGYEPHKENTIWITFISVSTILGVLASIGVSIFFIKKRKLFIFTERIVEEKAV